jgi:RNA polymerase sigma factor (TIGR02999 family)
MKTDMRCHGWNQRHTIRSESHVGNRMPEAELTELLQRADGASAQQRAQLFALLYDELHRMAQRELRRNSAATLSPTTLLHEAFLNISQRESAPFADRAKFMAYAARAMRGLLIDYLRNRQAQKRGGEFEITSLPTEVPLAVGDGEIARLGEAIDQLAIIDPRLAECVDLKFFCGFSFLDIAAMRSVTERTVRRDWEKARILLHQMLDAQPQTRGVAQVIA